MTSSLSEWNVAKSAKVFKQYKKTCYILLQNLNADKDIAMMGFYSRFLSVFMVFSKVQKDPFV